MEKICKVCGKPILAKRRRTFCSDKCYEISRSRKYNKTPIFNNYLDLLEKRRKSFNERINKHLQQHPYASIEDLKNFFADENLLYYERQVECYLKPGDDYLKAIISKLKESKGICELSHLESYQALHVHHLNSYDWFIKGRCDPKNMIVLDVRLHKLFHNEYGYGDNTRSQFKEFTEEYKDIIDNLNNHRFNQNLKWKGVDEVQ